MSGFDLSVFVAGTVHGQGSLTLWKVGQARHPPATVAWRNDVAGALRTAWPGDPWPGPVHLTYEAVVARPKTHWTSRGALRPAAPNSWHTGRKDLDRLVRLVGDALTVAGVIVDDAQIAAITATKRWQDAPTETPGAHIRLVPL